MDESKAFPFFLSSPSDGNTQTEEQRKEEQTKYKESCDKYILSGLNRNVTIKFLIEKLIGMGCMPPKGFMKCIDCGDKKAGAGFGVVEETVLPPSTSVDKDSISMEKFKREAKDRKKRQCQNEATLQDLQKQINAQNEGKVNLRLLPEIFLCQQHLVNEDHAHQSIVHELIHAIDLCRSKMDPINNCIHMACTEIRAENLSGECGAVREMINGRTSLKGFRGHGAECVKRRAVLSVQANPNCTEKAKDYVDAAFERCFKDTFPFDRHPNLR